MCLSEMITTSDTTELRDQTSIDCLEFKESAHTDETEALCVGVSMPAASHRDNIICRQVPVCLYLGLQSSSGSLTRGHNISYVQH